MHLACDVARCGTGEYCPRASQCLRHIDRDAEGCYRVPIITPDPVDCEHFVQAKGSEDEVSG